MTVYAIQPSFARGELSPRLRARIDIDHYRSGLAVCENFYVMRQGGLRRRPPTLYQGPTKFPNTNAVIRKFVFSVTQSYALEFGDYYMRVFSSAGQIVSGGSPYEVVTPWPASVVGQLQFTQSNDVLFVVHNSYPPHKISRMGETDWVVEPIEFLDGPYLDIVKDGTFLKPGHSGNLVPTMDSNTAPSGVASASSTLTTGPDVSEYGPFSAYRAFDGNPNSEWRAEKGGGGQWLKYEYPTAKIVNGYYIQISSLLERYSVDDGPDILTPGSLRAPRSWTIDGSNDDSDWTILHTKAGVTGWGDGERRYYSFSNDVAYKYYRLSVADVDDSNSTTNPRPLSIARWAMSGGGADEALVTLRVSKRDSINRGAGFKTTDVGRHVRLLDEDAVWHWYMIEEFVDADTVRARLKSPPLPSDNRTTSFRLGAFATSEGFPSCVALWQERLFYAGTKGEPQTVWGSKRYDFYDFGTSTPLVDDDALTLKLSDVGPIAWMADAAELLIGTVSSVRPLGVSDRTQGFSAKNFNLGQPIRVGALAMQPVQCGEATLFVNRYGNAIHELVSDGSAYQAPDLSVLSEHIFRGGIRDIDYATSPNGQLFCALNDGSLGCATYERDQKTIAFHRSSLGGGALVRSVCSTPGPTRDDVWFIARRNGAQFVLKLGSDFDNEEQEERFHLDEALTYRGSAVTTVTGLGHLANQTVGILADGAVEVDAVVSNTGSVALPSGAPSQVIHVGLRYTSRATTLQIPSNGNDGSGFGRKKRVKKVIVSLQESGTCTARAAGVSEEMLVRDTGNDMDEVFPLITTDVKASVDDSWERRGVITLEAEDPVPCTILAITPAFESEP